MKKIRLGLVIYVWLTVACIAIESVGMRGNKF